MYSVVLWVFLDCSCEQRLKEKMAGYEDEIAKLVAARQDGEARWEAAVVSAVDVDCRGARCVVSSIRSV